MGILKLILESDAKELSRNLEFFQLSFTGREANVGALLCAKQASACRSGCLLINYDRFFFFFWRLNYCQLMNESILSCKKKMLE